MASDLIPSVAGSLITVNPNWLAEKEEEVKTGEEALAELKRIPGISQSRVTRAATRLRFVRRYVALLKEGFIPIPRMEFSIIELLPDQSWDGEHHLYLDRMPVQALRNVGDFKNKFDTIGLVEPAGSGRKRDPILIGIIRAPGHEEHFILYFWRPELYRPADLW